MSKERLSERQIATSQERADCWLEVWQALRRHGLRPAERDKVIEREINRYHEQRFHKAVNAIRQECT